MKKKCAAWFVLLLIVFASAYLCLDALIMKLRGLSLIYAG